MAHCGQAACALRGCTLESLLPKTCLEPDCELESVQVRQLLSLGLCGLQPAWDTQLKYRCRTWYSEANENTDTTDT